MFTAGRVGGLVLLCVVVILTIQTRRTESIAADYARSLAQATADAAALAGAGSFLESEVAADTARRRALESIRANANGQEQVQLSAKEIEIDLEQGHVAVEVEARLRAFPVPIAWLLSNRELVVSATATGEAQSVRCQELGQSEDGFPLVRCEGIAKTLRLLTTGYVP